MEISQDDTETPRGLIENFVEQSTVTGARKRRFFRTPKKDRTIGGISESVKRRHASASSAMPAAKKQKQNKLSESSLTPRTLVEQLTGEEEATEDTLRVESRAPRSRRHAATNASLNLSHNRSGRSSLRKKVAVKQMLRGNVDEATPRGLIEGFLTQGDESATLILDTNRTQNKTMLAEVDIPSRTKNISLGESFFISNSAPEPRHLQNKKSTKKTFDREKFVQQLDSNVDKIENRTDTEGAHEAGADTPSISTSPRHSTVRTPSTDEAEGQVSTAKAENSSEKKKQRKRSWIYKGPKKRRRKKTNSDTSFVSTSSMEEGNGTESSSSHVLREAHMSEGHISFTTNIQQMTLKDVTQTDRTEELQRVLSSRRVSAVTPGLLPSLSPTHLQDTAPLTQESPPAADNSSGDSSLSPVIERSMTHKQPPRLQTSAHMSTNDERPADSTANESIANRLSRRKSRENIVELTHSSSKLRHSDVIDDGDDAAPEGDVESDREEDKDVSSDEDIEEDDDQEDDEENQDIPDQLTQPEVAEDDAISEKDEDQSDDEPEKEAESDQENMDMNTANEEFTNENIDLPANKDSIPEQSKVENMSMGGTRIMNKSNKNSSQNMESRLRLRRSDGAPRGAVQQEVSTRNESDMEEGMSTMGDTTNANNTTRLHGYDTLRTPRITTPQLPNRKGIPASSSTPGTSHQKSNAAVATKPRNKRATMGKNQAPPRLPKALTKSIFSHFASLGFTRDTLIAVEKVADKFWENMVNDVKAYATHAHRVIVERADMELLMNRQGFITDKQSLNTLIEKWLPLEYRHELIPIAKAGNKVVPKLK